MKAAAILTDPEAGACPPCPCHETPGRGAAYGWHARKGPLPILQALHGLPSWGRPDWIDHAYRLRLPDGRWCYVVEPYNLDVDALGDLAYLARHDFDVTVTAWRARHYPGHTVAVAIVGVTP